MLRASVERVTNAARETTKTSGGIATRKVVAGLFMTLDGVVDSPGLWQARYFDEEIADLIGHGFAQSDTLLLGRRTYQEFAEYWPRQGSETPLARQMNETQKLVVSSTLKTVEWANSSLVGGNLADELAKLKRAGKNIRIPGSPTLVESLLRDGLLDELSLLVHPIIVGGGRRLFEHGAFCTALRLVESRSFGTGVVSLRYESAIGPAGLGG
jgi:dihydrofolate reductase